MRICNYCKKPIPLGMPHIHCTFEGKFGETVQKLTGDSVLDFCSISCFEAFTFKRKAKGEKLDIVERMDKFEREEELHGTSYERKGEKEK